MRRFTLEYVLEGQRRGYSLRDPNTGEMPALPSDTGRALWKSALPRGQGWGDPVYLGARSLKVFPLPSGEIAFSRSIVTDLRDEAGRAGIRQAEIHLLSEREAETALVDALAALPTATVAAAENRLNSREWGLLFRKVREGEQPRSFVKPQTVLGYGLTSPPSPLSVKQSGGETLTSSFVPPLHLMERGSGGEVRSGGEVGWQFVEACLLLLVTRQTLLANLIEVTPKLNPFADRIVSMTTLALDYRDESRLVGMPIAAAQAAGIPFVDIREG